MTKIDKVKRVINYAISNNLSDRSKGLFARWLTASQNETEKEAALEEIWSSVDSAKDGREEIGLTRLIQGIVDTKTKRVSLVYRISTFAAAAAIAAGIFVGGYFTSYNYSDSPKTFMSHIITSDNSTGRYTLPDSSVVWLCEGSELSYSGDFGDKSRDVILNGGGYFEVTHDKTKPFRVQMNTLEVEVLGTTFDVRSYGNSDIEEVVLIEGSVAVSADDVEIAILKPNDKFDYNRITGMTQLSRVEGANYKTWMESTVRFEDSDFSDVVVQLERKYNIKIDVDNQVDVTRLLNFTVDSETPLRALRTLARLCDLELVEISENAYKLNNI